MNLGAVYNMGDLKKNIKKCKNTVSAFFLGAVYNMGDFFSSLNNARINKVVYIHKQGADHMKCLGG